jgi:hypothetical protein
VERIARGTQSPLLIISEVTNQAGHCQTCLDLTDSGVMKRRAGCRSPTLSVILKVSRAPKVSASRLVAAVERGN